MFFLSYLFVFGNCWSVKKFSVSKINDFNKLFLWTEIKMKEIQPFQSTQSYLYVQITETYQ